MTWLRLTLSDHPWKTNGSRPSDLGDARVRRDPLRSGSECLRFRGDQFIWRAKIGASLCFRMKGGSAVELGVEFLERQSHHEDIEGPSAENSITPQERKKILRNYQVSMLSFQVSGNFPREPSIPFQQGALPGCALFTQTPDRPGTPKGHHGRTRDLCKSRLVPLIVCLAESPAIQRAAEQRRTKIAILQVRLPLWPPLVHHHGLAIGSTSVSLRRVLAETTSGATSNAGIWLLDLMAILRRKWRYPGHPDCAEPHCF